MKAGRPFILTYHSIDNSGSPVSLGPEMFRAHMRALAASGRPVVPLERVTETPAGVAITFDDGLRNFHEQALPVLYEYGFPATVFVVSGYCGKTNDWPGQPAWVPRIPMMDWGEISEAVSSGISIGAHTVTHPKLPDLLDADIERELRDCREQIEAHTGRAVCAFAYPYGASDARVRSVAGRHFKLAVGTELGYLGRNDRLALPRLDAYYLQNVRWFERLGSRSGELYIAARAGIRRLRSFQPY